MTSTKKSGANHQQQKTRARRRALQALYQWMMADGDIRDIEQQFLGDQDMEGVDLKMFAELLHEIPKMVDELDGLIAPHLSRPIEQLDPIEWTVLRIGAYELSKSLQVPVRVVINESVDITKAFGAEGSHKFVNGVLDKVARDIPLRQAEIQKKQGKTAG